MKLLTFTRTLGLGLFLFGPLPVSSAGGQSDLVQLRVSVFNSSPLLPSTIEGAEREASRVLRYTGVEVLWLNCPQDAQHEASLGLCSEASFPTHLHLRILPASRGLKATTLGISFLAEGGKGCYADLFHEPMQKLQEETHVSAATILGHAMAHELGHLLLGTNSHSPIGLMRAHWDPEDLTRASRGALRFSHEQSLHVLSRFRQAAPTDRLAMVMARN